MSITNECMLVNLQIGVWMGHRLDKEASRRVTEEASAADGAARVNKHLVPPEALKAITSAATAVRAHFYKHTLPWKDNGDRVLTRKSYMNFVHEHAALVDKFNTEVTHFLQVLYPAARDQAEFRMGELFKATDYPSPSRLAGRYYVNLDIDPIAEAGDFRVAIDKDAAEKVRTDVETAVNQRVSRAMYDVWERLGDALGHFAETMATDGVFRNSTVSNLASVVDALPDLNFLNDPNLTRIADSVRRTLSGLDPKDLRTDKPLRTQAATEAQRIMDEMQGFMNAFNGAKK